MRPPLRQRLDVPRHPLREDAAGARSEICRIESEKRSMPRDRPDVVCLEVGVAPAAVFAEIRTRKDKF